MDELSDYDLGATYGTVRSAVLMRTVGFWLVVAALSAALLFLMAPVVLTVVEAVCISVVLLAVAGVRWFLIAAVFTVLFALPLLPVAIIFRGTYQSLRRR